MVMENTCEKDLLAELLFNKSKLKALNDLKQLQTETVVNSNKRNSMITELQSIFVDYIANDDFINENYKEFMTFFKQELTSIICKFHKQCNLKCD
jgi:hypothetical protein